MRDNRNNNRSNQKRSFSNKVDILGDRVPDMHKAKCDNCGRTCEVPFKPSNGKPVYCDNCFASMRDGSTRTNKSDRRNSSYNDRNDRQFFTATCDECGKECELPFKPSSNKPVYCSDCFEKRGNSSRSDRGNNNDVLLEQLNKVNQKLDKIMQILNSYEE